MFLFQEKTIGIHLACEFVMVDIVLNNRYKNLLLLVLSRDLNS